MNDPQLIEEEGQDVPREDNRGEGVTVEDAKILVEEPQARLQEELIDGPMTMREDRKYPDKKAYKEPRNQILKNHEIVIQFLDVGMVVRLGCKSIAFTTLKEGMSELNKYVKDPYTAIQKWHKIFNQEEN